jgi:hypothetical protein
MSDYSLSIEAKPSYLHARVTGTNSQENVFGYMQQVCDACAARRIAFVDVNPEHDFSHRKLMETYATNRGLNIRVFTTTKAAQNWLEERE